ncbi:MAG: ROK family protein [Eubacterium sp.]
MIEQDALKNIRNKNMSDILQVLRDKGACSLSELTDNTDGGLTTVKKCMLQAMDYGMIVQGDVADSTGGRKAKQYLINEEYQYFLFIIVDNNNLMVKIHNFKFECIKEFSEHFNINDFIDVIYRKIDIAIQQYNIGTVCLSIPCVIKNGVIIDWYYNQERINFDLKSNLEKKYCVNVIVQNDMKLTALGTGRHNTDNIVTAQFGHNGIGMAGMINGHLLEGATGFAGEIGYINDIRKNVMGVSYPAKIVRNAIVFLNPEIIVFYKSERQNNFKQIFDTATKGLPTYAIPKFDVSDNYVGDIVGGLIFLINKYGYYRKKEQNI